MNREFDKIEDIENALKKEEESIQKEIEELDKRRERLKRMKSLEDKRELIQEDIYYLRGKKKHISFDQITFFDIVLFVILVLLAGALLAEGRVMGRYAIIPLIIALIIAWKLINKFA